MERRIEPLGTYSLAASTGFLEGFVPASFAGPSVQGHLSIRAELETITDGWRPFRTWVTLLVRTNLEETTHEIRDGGRPASR